jgi:hypothetical protein
LSSTIAGICSMPYSRALLIEDEVHFLERQEIVEVHDLVEHLSGHARRFRRADCLSEEQEPYGVLDDRQVSADGLAVLFREQRHGEAT